MAFFFGNGGGGGFPFGGMGGGFDDGKCKHSSKVYLTFLHNLLILIIG
jgi:hypothetical protein